jgi:DUF4097 and DUF4098 domain-containing protein YvlB
MNRMSIVKSAVLLAAIALAALPAAGATREVDQTVGADRDGVVSIENIAGAIRVEGWDKAEVRITGTLSDEVEELKVKDSGRRTAIKVVYPRKLKSINEGANLVIMVPRGSGLEIETVSADITVDKVVGAVEAASISGEISVMGGPARLEAETISGDLEIAVDTRAIELKSISGEIELRAKKAEVEAQTVSGDMDLAADTFMSLEIETVSGDVEVAGAFDREGRFEIDLHSGDLVLSLDGRVDADFSVETFSGGIDNAFGAKARDTGGPAPGKSLEFTAGEGGARVRIDTFSGDVTIRKR